MGCKARLCIRNPKLHYVGDSPYKVFNDFEKCNKKEYVSNRWKYKNTFLSNYEKRRSNI